MIRRLVLVSLVCLLFLVAPVIAAEKVNINTAGVEELDTIVEIGPVIAGRIIAYREANGPFVAIEDIMKVSGIKEATFAKIKDFITIGEPTPPDPQINPDNQLALPITTSGSDSTHSSPVELSKLDEAIGLTVSAGRDRSIATGSRLLFKATAKGLKDGGTNVDFYWNFGDGQAARGQGLFHTYRYPGTYNVVLTLSQGDNQAVSRLTVKVADPKVGLKPKVMASGESVVEIKNLAEEEVNLGEWQLINGREKFIFPADTIISEGASINLPLVGAADEVKLVASSEQVFARTYQFASNLNWHNLRIGLNRVVAKTDSKPNQLANVSLVEMPVVASLSQPELVSIATSSSIELPARQGWWSQLVGFIF